MLSGFKGCLVSGNFQAYKFTSFRKILPSEILQHTRTYCSYNVSSLARKYNSFEWDWKKFITNLKASSTQTHCARRVKNGPIHNCWDILCKTTCLHRCFHWETRLAVQFAVTIRHQGTRFQFILQARWWLRTSNLRFFREKSCSEMLVIMGDCTQKHNDRINAIEV